MPLNQNDSYSPSDSTSFIPVRKVRASPTPRVPIAFGVRVSGPTRPVRPPAAWSHSFVAAIPIIF